jgi:hypothetical protein
VDGLSYNARLEHARDLYTYGPVGLELIGLALSWGRDVTILPVPGREPWRHADSANAETPPTRPRPGEER